MKAQIKSRTMSFKVCGITALITALGLFCGCKTTPEPKQVATSQAAAKTESTETDDAIVQAAAKPTVALEGTGWKSLFDGRSLAGWQETDFAGHGTVECEKGLIVIEMGASLTGINFTNEVPKMNYEVALDAMKLQGSDFFCGLTFPVGDSFCTLILGGWGGAVTGLSSIDGEDASENETSQFIRFETNRWYHVRVRVTPKKIEAWLDDQKIIDLKTVDRKIELRFGEIELSKPLGIATYETRGAVREIKIRSLEEGAK